MTRKLLGFFIILICSTQIYAQERGNGEGRKNMPKIGSITAKVIDIETEDAVEYASVSLENLRSKEIVAGSLTGSKGDFEITELQPGKYLLKIDFIGYETFISEEILITPKKPDVNLGTLKISPDVSVLDDVTVTAERTYIENKIDKKVVNIGKDLLSAGASATDIMSNIPSVDVDIEGNISLRGNENVRILVDGRPTNMSSEELLSTIPAENIEKVEIITNPSAKYDPDGISGILNIILKKDKKLGFNGSATGGIGTKNEFSGINKYNGSLNLNYNSGDWNIFANYGYRNDTRVSEGEFERELFNEDGSSNGTINQISDNSRDRISHSLKAGADYYLSKKTTLGYTINARLSERGSISNIEYSDPFEARRTTNESERNSISHDLFFKHEFSKKSYLEISAFRSDSDDNSSSIFESENITGVQPNESDKNDGHNNLTSIQADYYLETEGGYKIDAGIKGQNRNLDSDYEYYFLGQSGEAEIDTNRANHYQFEESLYSVYTNLGKKWDKWAVQAGVRAEKALTESRLVEGEKYPNNYFNFFPSVFVTRKIGETNEIGISYSKRVSRPSSRQLNPAKRYSDTLNISSGNPFLKPEFTNSAEISFNKYWKGGSFNTAVFYRYTTDKIQRVVLVDENGVSTRTYGNISTASDIGYEASVMSKIFKWWSLNASLNVYYTSLDTDSDDFNNEGINWFTRINNNFSIGETWSLQASGRYMGKRVIPQGYLEPMYGIDFGVRKSLWNKKANISFRLSDVFNTYKFTYHTSGRNFVENGGREWESRVAYLTFTYNFGSKPKKQSKRKSGGREESEGGEMEL